MLAGAEAVQEAQEAQEPEALALVVLEGPRILAVQTLQQQTPGVVVEVPEDHRVEH
jgi:hypothetical protein